MLEIIDTYEKVNKFNKQTFYTSNNNLFFSTFVNNKDYREKSTDAMAVTVEFLACSERRCGVQ